MRFSIILLLLFFVSCQTKDERISEFQKDLGLEKAKALNLLLHNFEKNLRTVYPELTIDSAYVTLLNDVKAQKFQDWQMLCYLPENVLAAYKNSGLSDDFYLSQNTKRQINIDGSFFKSLKEQAYYNELIANYCWVIEDAGMLSAEQFASGILQFKFNPQDYFHKRLVVFQFSP